MHSTIPPEVMTVLRASTITECNVTLPPGQLARPLYEAVNKVLTNAGGKWNRSAKAHVFPSDPRPKLGLALETGKTINQQQVTQAFYTPPDVAAQLVGLANVSGCSVLEPSAGRGALAKECIAHGAKRIVCVESDIESCEVLRGRYEIYHADFLGWSPDQQFERVVMNPPFTKNQDVKHVIKALTHLAPGGRLVSIMAGNTTRTCFANLVEEWKATVIPLPAGAFKQSGTGVHTVIVDIYKP